MKLIFSLLLVSVVFQAAGQKADSVNLQTFAAKELYQDYDLLINSLKEAHTGLYWYNSKVAFEKMAAGQRRHIQSGMNELDFYRVVAPIIAYTKEGHTSLKFGKQVQDFMRLRALYLPAFVKIIGKKIYLINDLPGYLTKGSELLSVNGIKADNLLQLFMSFEPSDGYNLTGKYRWIEENGKFNIYYARCFPQVQRFILRYRTPDGITKIAKNIPALSYDQFRTNYTAAIKAIPNSQYSLPATIETDSIHHRAVLTINSFQKRRYLAAKMEFHDFIRQAFLRIQAAKITDLIIDIRRNGGGTEGYEDFLLSFMIRKDYVKYSSVQASAFHYSFYPYTDYRTDWGGLDSALRAEHYLAKDGRILRKPGIEEHEKPQQAPYLGNIYVLTSGLTYSGGSEFASLVRNYTNAIFIGEETGGGYYGNTSGYRITLQLPHTSLEIAIPILKFVVKTPKKINPVGHGIMPDIAVEPTIRQYLDGIDVELGKAKELISKREFKTVKYTYMRMK